MTITTNNVHIPDGGLENIFKEFQKERENLADLLAILKFENSLEFSIDGTQYYFVLNHRISDTLILHHTGHGLQISVPVVLSALANCEYDDVILTNDAVVLTGKPINPDLDKRTFKLVLFAGQYALDTLSQHDHIIIGTYAQNDNEQLSTSIQSVEHTICDEHFYEDQAISNSTPGQLTLSGNAFTETSKIGLTLSGDLKSDLKNYNDRYDADPTELAEMNGVLRGFKVVRAEGEE